MRRLPAISILVLFFSCTTTIKTFDTVDHEKMGVKAKGFRGTIFRNSYPVANLSFGIVDNSSRFTPTIKDIELAEVILKEQLKQLNKPRINQVGKGPNIDKKLNKYFRQYIGFFNDKGEKVVHINFCWDKFTFFDRIRGYTDPRVNYTSDYFITMDGGSYYWNVNANLTTHKLEGFEVNGLG